MCIRDRGKSFSCTPHPAWRLWINQRVVWKTDLFSVTKSYYSYVTWIHHEYVQARLGRGWSQALHILSCMYSINRVVYHWCNNLAYYLLTTIYLNYTEPYRSWWENLPLQLGQMQIKLQPDRPVFDSGSSCSHIHCANLKANEYENAVRWDKTLQCGPS